MKKSELRHIIREAIREHETGEEGKMAKYDSLELSKDASDVSDMIQNCTNLPEWVEAKITLAADYLNTVKDYLTNHMQLHEKKLGFSRADYDDETIDALKDFAQAGELLNQQIKEKQFLPDDPLVQQILALLDEDTQGELRELTQQLIDLVSELPDKPERGKIGFNRQQDITNTEDDWNQLYNDRDKAMKDFDQTFS